MVEGYVWEHICRKDVKNQYQAQKHWRRSKRFEAGFVPGTPVARDQRLTDWATKAVDRYWERIQSIESLWLRIETGIVVDFQGRVRFAVECHKVKIWSVQVPRTETAYRCLHERGDKGWYWTSLEGPWRKTTKVRMQSCNSFRHRHNA